MAAYHRDYDSRHLQADCRKPGSAPAPYAARSVIEYGLSLPVFKCRDCMYMCVSLAGRYGAELPAADVDPQQFVAQLLASSIAPPPPPTTGLSQAVSPVTSSAGIPAAVTSRKLASLATRPLESSNCVNRRKLQ